MSHFTEVKTKIREGRLLKKALEKLGYAVEEHADGVPVRGFFGETTPAEFKIGTGSTYDVGFRKTASGDYEVVGDWEILPRAAGLEREEFLRRVKRAYAETAIRAIAEERGLEVEVSEAEGSVEMVVSQW